VTAPDSEIGVAEVLAVKGRWVRVACCFGDHQHLHARESLGSAELLAGCHTPDLPRLYSLPATIPDRQKETRS
jgi:hypothetical protein